MSSDVDGGLKGNPNMQRLKRQDGVIERGHIMNDGMTKVRIPVYPYT